MGKYFGTDGFRGEANKELTATKAFKVGRYIGWYYGQQHEDGMLGSLSGRTREDLRTHWSMRFPPASPHPDRMRICFMLPQRRR